MPRPGSALSWPKKFAVAFSGFFWALRHESSFWVHVPASIVVLIVAALLQVDLWRWVALVMTITIVFVAELLNSAIEHMIKVLHPEPDERIGRALDIAAAGVLTTAIGAIIIGILALGQPIWATLMATME